MDTSGTTLLTAPLCDPLRVLLIEDSEEDTLIVDRSLARATRPSFALKTAATWESGRPLLEEERPDVVLLDLHLPDGDGLDLVRQAVNLGKQIPIVILTGIQDDQMALDALQLGAQDYLVKDEIGTQTLRRSIRHAVERQQILACLKEANQRRLQLKDEFLSHVSHELLTPLSAIYQFLEIFGESIRNEPGDRAQQQRMWLDVLFRNAVQLRRMIDDLMEATRLDTHKLDLDLDMVDLESCIRWAIHSASPEAARRQLDLVSEVDSVPLVIADEARVRQVLSNLLSNALKFTPRGGRVSVHVEDGGRDPGVAHVWVEDTGQGIHPEALPHVFERLYQDRERTTQCRKGVGIGLYICRELIRRMRGEIWVESELGSGSRFHFTLPIHSLRDLIESRIDLTQPASLVLVALQQRNPTTDSVRQVEDSNDAGSPPLPSIAFEVLVAEAHRRLRRLVWNQCDIVLPRYQAPSGKAHAVANGRLEIFPIVAQADQAGAAAMCARVQQSLEVMVAELAPACAIQVESRPLHSPREQACSTQEVTARVEQLLEEVLASFLQKSRADN